MEKDEMKNKCTERAKIFQQAMESCHSSNPMDCIEWFADRIADLEKELEITRRCWVDQKNISLDTNCKLHKAKEIIKELLDTQSRLDPYRDIFKDRILKAEQFLNSEV